MRLFQTVRTCRRSILLLSSFIVAYWTFAVSCGHVPLPGTFDPSNAAAIISRQIVAGDYWAADRASQVALSHQISNEWAWRFKLLRAEALLRIDDWRTAQRVIETPPPASLPQIQPRYQYLRAYLGFDLREANAPDRLRTAVASAKALSDRATEIEALLLQAEIQPAPQDGSKIVAQALELARQYKLPYQQANALNELGMVALEAGRFAEAVQPFSEAAALAKQVGAGYVEAAALANLGECYFDLGDLDRSLRSFSEARPLLRPSDHTQLAVNINNQLGTLYSLRQQNSRALEFYRSAFAIAKQTGGSSLRYIRSAISLAAGLIETTNLDEAEFYNNLASAAIARAEHLPGNEILAANELNRGGILAGHHRLREAELCYGKVLRLMQDQPPSSIQWSASARLAETQESLGKTASARRNYEMALIAIETNRSRQKSDAYEITFLSALIGFYQKYVDFLIRQNQLDDALAVADSSRAGVLIGGEFSSRRQPNFARRIHALASNSNSALVFYWLSPNASYVWGATPTGDFFQKLSMSADEVERDVNSYLASIQSDQDVLAVQNKAGLRLYRALIGPLAPYLQRGMRVVVVPDGVLHGLNFETLLVEGKSPHYWLEDASITVAPSLGLLLKSGAKNSGLKKTLVVGNPSYEGTEYPQLPESAREVAQVGARYPNSVMLTQKQAVAEAYLKANPSSFSLIHFSAHVDANAQSPLDSAIILSPQTGDNASSRLYARDVMNTPLNADLVTISGCSSSGAKTISGEGMVGFAWASFKAGARNTVTSLWAVDDRSTADLMDRFYGGITSGMNYSDALRQAKLDMLRNRQSPFKKPYYWAPFQLYSQNITPL